ncbi:MAG: MBL fold metallo-hydrolase [Bryobacteraceae bacterium]|nr:MBL fold metallo-hydrolase [Bryobacteraceae bacterium]
MRKVLPCLVLLALLPLLAAKELAIHFIDVEGGQCTLIIAPSGQSLLVDTGWPGLQGRDADRIVQTAKKAGLKRIDHLLITHYHTDHVGGIVQLAERFPVSNFIVHGKNTETGKGADNLQESFDRASAKGTTTIVKPGDSLPLKGLDIKIVSARGELIAQPLPGAGQPNPLCADATRKDADPSENARSLGFVLTYGKFRFADLGDLTWNKETDLACPVNKLGKLDVLLGTHHGSNQSNPPALVHALAPRVVVVNNGAKKGGDASSWKIFKSSPGLEDLWQLHFAVAAGKEANVEDPYIANLQSPGGGNLLLTVEPSGQFRLLNLRNKFEKVYKPR